MADGVVSVATDVALDVEHLCDEAESLLVALNRYRDVCESEDDDTIEAENAVSEAFQAVSSAIYYARKRVLGVRRATRTSWEDSRG